MERMFTLDEYEDVKRRAYVAGVQAALKVLEPWLENHSPIDDLMNTIDAVKEGRA